MPLFLVESPLPDGGEGGVQALIQQIADTAKEANGELIEVQVGVEAQRVYAILEHRVAEVLDAKFRSAGIDFDEVAPVRLVGAELEEVKAKRPEARYLVEWDIPAGITMEQYLTRKREKAPLYAQVPEATFLRTYVREDMIKCLCFYDGEDEDAVRRARAAVDTPIDRLTRLAE